MGETKATADAGNTLTAGAMVSLLLRRKYLVLPVFLMVLGGSAAYVLLLPEKYDAELKLMIKRARVEAPVDGEASGATLTAEVSETEIASETELLRNRSTLEETALACGLVREDKTGDADARRRLAAAVRELERKLRVSRIGKTNLISVRYSHGDPEQAARVLKVLSEVYLRKHMAVHRNRDATEFFTRQAEAYARGLTAAQQQLAEFRQRHEISLLAVQKETLMKRHGELQAAATDLETQIQEANRRMEELRRQREGLPATIQTERRMARNEALLDRLKGLLLDLENKRTELLTKYDPGYRLVQEVERQIRDTRAAIEREQQTAVVDRKEAMNPLRQEVEAELLRTEASVSGLAARRENALRDLERVRARQVEYEKATVEHDDLERRVKLAEENYLLYRKKQEESRLADAMDKVRILNVSVVEAAKAPGAPAEQPRAFMMLLGGIVAGFASMGLALLADQRSRARGGEAEAVPPEATLVEAETVEAAETACEVMEAEAGLSPGPERPAAQEEVTEQRLPAVRRRARAAEVIPQELAFQSRYEDVIGYLSSLHRPEHGVALGLAPWIPAREAAEAAAQLAHSMNRRNGLPVLLVDAGDSGQPLSQYFGAGTAPGFRDLLAGPPGIEKQCLHQTPFKNLWILPAGDPRLDGGVPEARLKSLQKALANRSVNLLAHLPHGRGAGPVLLYSVLDAVISDLNLRKVSDQEAAEIVRRVMEAKRIFAERRLTLVGGAGEWSEKEKQTLMVC